MHGQSVNSKQTSSLLNWASPRTSPTGHRYHFNSQGRPTCCFFPNFNVFFYTTFQASSTFFCYILQFVKEISQRIKQRVEPDLLNRSKLYGLSFYRLLVRVGFDVLMASLQTSRSQALSSLRFSALISSFTLSFHCFLGLPLGHTPGTFNSIISS